MDDLNSNRHIEDIEIGESSEVIYIFLSLGLTLALISIICGCIIYCNLGRRRLYRRYISPDNVYLPRRRELPI